MHLLLARAAVTAGRWQQAAEQLHAARRHVTGDADPVVARIDALAAHVAIGEGHPEEGASHAARALAATERGGLPAVACEALEVIGRSVRERDLPAAEAAFENYGDAAVWRPVHPLGQRPTRDL